METKIQNNEFPNSNTRFVQKFRWTMEGNDLPYHCFKKVKIDFKSQKLILEIYEIIDLFKDDIYVHNWLSKELNKENLLFKTYDGCGTELYQYEFKNLTLLKDKSSFDYSCSKTSVRKIKIHYNSYVRKILYEKQDQVVEDIQVDKKQYNNFEIEEVEMNLLNSKYYIPGRVSTIIPENDVNRSKNECK